MKRPPSPLVRLAACACLALMPLAACPAVAQDPPPVEIDLTKGEGIPHPEITLDVQNLPVGQALRRLEQAAEGQLFIRLPAGGLPGNVTLRARGHFEVLMREVLKSARRPVSYYRDGRVFVLQPGGVMPQTLLLPVHRTPEARDDALFAEESSRPIPVVQSGHPGRVEWVQFSPNGRLLASGGGEGLIYLWDIVGRRSVRTLAGRSGGQGFSADGRHLVSAVGPNLLQWRVATGHIRRRKPDGIGGPPHSMAMDRHGGVVAGSIGGGVTYAHSDGLGKGRTLLPAGPRVYNVGLSPDGGTAFAWMAYDTETPEEAKEADEEDPGRKRVIHFWETRTGRRLFGLSPEGNGVSAVAVSPDRRFVFVGTQGGRTEVWSLKNRQRIKTLAGSAPGEVRFAFSPDGTRLAIGSGSGVAVWRIEKDFSLATTYPAGGVAALSYSPDGRFLATGASGGGRVAIWDVRSRQTVAAFHPASRDVDFVALSPDGGTLLSRDGGRLRRWDAGMARLPQDAPAEIAGQETLRSPDGEALAAATRDGKIALWDTATLAKVRTLEPPPDAPKGVTARVMDFSASSQYLAAAGWNGEAYVWDAKTGECRVGPLAGEHRGAISYVGLSGDHRRLVTKDEGGRVVVWDLTTSKPLHVIDGPGKRKEQDLTPKLRPVPPSRGANAAGGGQGGQQQGEEAQEYELVVTPPDTSPIPWDQFPPRGGDWLAVSRHPQPGAPQYLAVTSQLRTFLYDLESGHLIKVLGAWNPVFHPGRPQALLTNGNRLLAYDPATGQETKSVNEGGENITFSPDGRLIATSATIGRNGLSQPVVTLLNARDLSRAATFHGHTAAITSLWFSKDGARLVTGSRDGTARLWDATDDRPALTSKPTTPRPAKERHVATFIGLGGPQGYVVVTRDGYYMASKQALTQVAFRFGDAAYAFDQFDLRLNRPDIVLARLGRAPKPLIESLQTAHRMRLFKMGLAAAADAAAQPGGKHGAAAGAGLLEATGFELPEVDLKEGDLPTTVTARELSFTVLASDEKHELRSVVVYVNDVPLYGEKGKDVSAARSQKLEVPVTVRLLPGRNKIQVSARNGANNEALRLTQYVVCQTAQRAQPRLYVLAIGVSKYRAAGQDLEDADKDAREVAAFFQSLRKAAATSGTEKAGKKAATGAAVAAVAPPTAGPDYGARYAEVRARTLTNEEATRENIRRAAAELLGDAREEDHVVLFFAGHGMIGADMRYYFAAHETALNDLAETGLPYEEIETLLAGVRAQQRLLLLDTCQSGEIYVDPAKAARVAAAIEAAQKAATAGDGVGGGEGGRRGFGALLRGKPGVSLTEEDAASLARELFADLRRGAGADVIAAAGGLEYAQERAGNGLFTRALLQVLRECQRAGRSITVSELRDRVAVLVAAETKGEQKPVVRADSLEFDFPLLLTR